MTNIVLGIDTGGTYTDGVLLDQDSKQIIASTKKLTTHHNLSICIEQVLDHLLPQTTEKIHLVSISTTLATNAIAEGKFKPVALFLLGYDPQLVENYDLGGRFVTTHYHFFQGGHLLSGEEQAPLEEDQISKKVTELMDDVEAFAVSGYFSPRNNQHETRTLEEIRKLSQQPVVLGHQLSSRLDSIRRATTATLNASLLSVMQDFITAMQRALQERGVDAPLMIVRGNGSLMNLETANHRPIETIHSGPAASAIGGRFLAGSDKALIIDVGGTTTDIAIIDHGNVTVLEEGTTVGQHRTSIQSANVRSFGLGGDSIVQFDAGKILQVGPERVVPISYLASLYPHVREELRQLSFYHLDKRPLQKQLEYWFLQREPRRSTNNSLTSLAVDLLRERPMTLANLMHRLGVRHLHQFDGEMLLREDIVSRSALTPTDLLHISGEYAPWDSEAANLAASLVVMMADWTVEKLISEVNRTITEKIVAEIVTFITGKTMERVAGFLEPDDLGLWLFEENLSNHHPYLGSKIYLKMPIIGMGAPAKIYLPRVAEVLGTELILPPNYQVANAVGAVAGNVAVTCEAQLKPHMDLITYDLLTSNEQRTFESLSEAIKYGREILGEQALLQARESGAREPHLEFQEEELGAYNYRLVARAVGSPHLDGRL